MTLVLKPCLKLVGLRRTYNRLVALLVLTQLLIHGMSGAVLSGDPLFGHVVPRPSYARRPVLGLAHNGGNYKLYSKSARSVVQVRPRTVNARASDDRYTDLIFHIDDSSGTRKLRIQGASAKSYICFNKHGKLIARYEEDSDRCQFTEDVSPLGYTELRSVANPLWYIGFRRNGKPLRGYKAQQHDWRWCFGLTVTPSRSNTRRGGLQSSSQWSLPHGRFNLQTTRHRHRRPRHRWRLPSHLNLRT